VYESSKTGAGKRQAIRNADSNETLIPMKSLIPNEMPISMKH
jgi:hypothetical protein